ncbi:thioredoxin-like fold domain-containing protein MRL7L, chloroplastic [Nymphaea colorata]|nr:thioredoxin-like fold domain-containing protein MRL7L, chloroplastic [Nymphaea colorata]
MALQKPLWIQGHMVIAPSAVSRSFLPQKPDTRRVCRLLLPHSDKAAAACLTKSSADPAPLWKKLNLKHLARNSFVVQSSQIDAAEHRDAGQEVCNNRRKESGDSEEEEDSDEDDDIDDRPFIDQKERWEMRRKIRQIIDANPSVEEERGPEEKKKLMEQLLSEYPLVVDEEDPNWPEDSDGWGFNLSQFFNKVTIKNVRKDDEDYDSEKEIEWHDDNYIRAVKDISSKEWEETVFKDISPLIILVHNRYKRPKENERARNHLEKAVQIFWDSGLPSPRCVAIDAVVEDDLVAALKISTFPELLFTKAGKIFYRQTVISNADELSKIMAFFYYGATRPACLSETDGEVKELIPALPGRS